MSKTNSLFPCCPQCKTDKIKIIRTSIYFKENGPVSLEEDQPYQEHYTVECKNDNCLFSESGLSRKGISDKWSKS